MECANCGRALRDPGVGLLGRLLGDHPEDAGFACDTCGRRVCSGCRSKMAMNVGMGYQGKCSSCGGELQRR